MLGRVSAHLHFPNTRFICASMLGNSMLLSKKLPSAIASSLPLEGGGGGRSMHDKKNPAWVTDRKKIHHLYAPRLPCGLKVVNSGLQPRSDFSTRKHPRPQLSEARVTQSAATGAPVAGDADTTPTTYERAALGIVTRRAETTYPRWLRAQHRARPEGERPVSLPLALKNAPGTLAAPGQVHASSGAPA